MYQDPKTYWERRAVINEGVLRAIIDLIQLSSTRIQDETITEIINERNRVIDNLDLEDDTPTT